MEEKDWRKNYAMLLLGKADSDRHTAVAAEVQDGSKGGSGILVAMPLVVCPMKWSLPCLPQELIVSPC